jgi:hypothetical protein
VLLGTIVFAIFFSIPLEKSQELEIEHDNWNYQADFCNNQYTVEYQALNATHGTWAKVKTYCQV